MAVRSRPRLTRMADALTKMVKQERDRLRYLEQCTYDEGIEPGPDLAFAGVRLMVMRAEDASALMRRLVPHEDAFFAWLEAVEQPVIASPGQL
jgi:hypothetical protein